MKIYTVHVNPEEAEPLETAIFVKEGASVWAAIFQPFWSLYNKMWICAVLLLGANILLGYLDMNYFVASEVLTALNTGLIILVALSANDWYRLSLKKRGYILFDVVSGDNEAEAQQRFFDGYISEFTS